MSQSFAFDLNDFQVAVHNALTSWDELGSSEEALLAFLLLVQEKRDEIGDGRSPLELRRATNEVLLVTIDELEKQAEIEATVLRARFIEGEITRQVANRLHASPDQVNRWQRTAIEDLTHLLLSRELVLREERQQKMEAMLPPPPYTRLFGFDTVMDEAAEKLLQPDGNWIVAIVGIGGIGKTSLADAVARRVIRELTFEQAIWLRVSSRSLSGAALAPEQGYEQFLTSLAEKLFPAAPGMTSSEQHDRLRQALKVKPHLIIVDNLETEAETVFFLEHVRELASPSKFLLTSRARPTVSATAYFVSVHELPWSDAAVLLRHLSATMGLDELAEANESVIEEIYTLTGGNPLALKLVVSLAAVLPLPQILSDLAKSRPGPIEDLYRSIYWEAWRTLSGEGQSLLQAMPLVAETGALPAQLMAFSDLDETTLWPALTELVSRSLMEVRGTMHERRYGIHRLTETFLRTEIIHWPEG